LGKLLNTKGSNMAKILVVDDSKMIRNMVVYTLNEGGYNDIDEAEDGLIGVSKTSQTKYDAIITDINMPNMNGFEFTITTRNEGLSRQTPILILTTESSQEMKEKGRLSGATGWIIKPFIPEELLEAVSIILSKTDR